MRSIDLFRSSSNAPAETKEEQSSEKQAKCILCVVGSSQIQGTVEQSLESIGLDLIFVNSGEAADEFLNKRSAVIVISEIELPMMNGLSLARRIKEDAKLGDVPVLLISDSSEGPDKVMGMETGADDYITTPINPSDLRSRVMSLLSRTKNEYEVEGTSDLNITDTQENDTEETVIGAGAQSIPVDELGLDNVDLAPAEPSEPPQESVTEQPESAIIEELNPVTNLNSSETKVPLEEELPKIEEAQPEKQQAAIVEEADPFKIQSAPQSDVNVSAPIDDKPESSPTAELETVITEEVNVEPVVSQPVSTDETENVSAPSTIEPEVGTPDLIGVKDPGTESMIDDIFGSSAHSDATRESNQEIAPQPESPVTPPPPTEAENVVQSAYVPLPVQPVTPVEPVAQQPVQENLPPVVQPQQITQPTAPQPAMPQQPAQPPVLTQPVVESTIIPADQPPVQTPSVVPPAAPIQDQPQVASPIPVEAEAPQFDMNEAALAGFDYEAKVDDIEVYETTISDLKELETKVINGDNLDFNKLILDARKIVSSVQQSNYLHVKAIGKREAHDFPVHSLNVTIFSAKLATGLNYDNKTLTELAVSALLHDVGMLLLPEELRHAKSKISDKEFAVLKTHPNIGSEYMTKALQTNPELAPFGFLPTVVLQEHERYDGTGYPNGIVGDEIHDYAKIISIIDMYEAVSHPSTYRDEYLAYEALQKVVALKDTYFDVKFLRALVREISVFPIGSLVRLNNGEIGRVIALNSSHPMRPKLKILYNAEGEKYPEEKDIELDQAPFLYIETPITEEEIPNKSDN